MVAVLPHVPSNGPQLLDGCCEPSFTGEVAVLKPMPIALVLSPSFRPTPSESCLPAHQALKSQRLPEIIVVEFKVFQWSVLSPQLQTAANNVGNIRIGVVVEHPIAQGIHRPLPCFSGFGTGALCHM
jgi:hypothetical protein